MTAWSPFRLPGSSYPSHWSHAVAEMLLKVTDWSLILHLVNVDGANQHAGEIELRPFVASGVNCHYKQP